MAFTLSTLNLNGIRAAARNGFHGWLAEADPDVLCLQELRIQADQMLSPEHQPPPAYAAVQADAEKKGYSGTAVWSKLPVLGQGIGCAFEDADREGRVAWMDLQDAAGPLRVYSMYFPSGSSGDARQAAKERFLDHIGDWLQPHLDLGEAVAVCGDVNIAHTEQDIHNPKGNAKNSGFLPHERDWMTGFLGRGWVDVFRQQNPDAATWSWWSNRGQARALDRGWRIDYILASPALAARAQACWITGSEPAVSDHCAVNARFG